MSSNKAAFLDKKGESLRVGDAEMPKLPGPDYLIIRNKSAAVNPVDWKIQQYGFAVKSWPTILGTDVSGNVVDVGAGVRNIKKGDRVTAHSISLATGNKSEAGFALYSALPASTTAVIPSSISYADASVIPLAFDTAAVGLYSSASKGFLGLAPPSLKPSPSGKTVVVWGGSSSVGSMAIQLAVASGAKVIATSSSHNFDFCKRCGAAEVFDYKSASVVDDVVKAVKASGDFAGVYDSFSAADQSYKLVLPVLEKLGGGNLAVVLPGPAEVPANVKVGNVNAINPLTHPLWRDFVPKALESGLLKCLPEPLVVGKGLENVQKGLEENKKGVSARKVVIEL